MSTTQTLLFLVLPLIFVFLMISWLASSRRHSQMKKLFLITLVLLAFWFANLILQILLSTYYNFDPLIFENFTYISACLAPILIYFISLVFKNPKMEFTAKHASFFIVPIITLLILWTNNIHHLFYIDYSIDINKTTFGAYFYIHSVYTYTILLLGLFNLVIHSIKTSGAFSKQSILFFVGTSIPVLLNFLGTFKVITMTIYITPISFSLGLLFYAIAIFKYDFLNVTPIALDLVVNTISDGYMVLDEDNVVINFNKAFLNLFKLKQNDLKNRHVFEVSPFIGMFKNNTTLVKHLAKAKSGSTVSIEKSYGNKYFLIDISPIYKDKSFIGTLVFVNNITQHKNDMQTIKDNQSMLVEKERLASLGQMIGGIAHNLKTPIFSVTGGLEGLTDLINEFDSSIDDPIVTNDDMHAIAQDMHNWIEKLKNHISYMSDVITAVKGQAVTLSDDDVFDFTIDELFKQIHILMKHELQNALITLNINNTVENTHYLKGNINSLVQVINNILSNAIEAYDNEPNQTIDLSAKLEKNGKIIIEITDYGPGIPIDIKNKLFKEMITTKGKDGTGLGLFMSYSTIKAHFKGDMNFKSEIGNGTTFTITLPCQK